MRPMNPANLENSYPVKSKSTLKKKIESTLREIRAGLELDTFRSSVFPDRVPSQISIVHEESPKAISSLEEDDNEDVPVKKVLYFCYEIQGLVRTLEKKRQIATQEWHDLFQVVTQFECLYNSVRIRDSQFIHKVQEQQLKFNAKEEKFQLLVNRAETHLQSLILERNRLFLDTAKVKARTTEMETQLITVHDCMKDQKYQVELLQKELKDMPSEKEMTGLNLTLRRLQNENSQLMTDCADLKLIFDDLCLSLQKRHPLLRPYEAYLPTGKTETLENSADQMNEEKSIEELKKMNERLEQAIVEQRNNFDSRIGHIRKKKAKFESYIKTLSELLSE